MRPAKEGVGRAGSGGQLSWSGWCDMRMEQEVGPGGKSLGHHSQGLGVSFYVEIVDVSAVLNLGGVVAQEYWWWQ